MSHGHSHSPANFDRAFIIGILLNSGFVMTEAVFGFLSHSLALLADAGHNLGDVLGLVMAWTASYLVKRAPTRRHTPIEWSYARCRSDRAVDLGSEPKADRRFFHLALRDAL